MTTSLHTSPRLGRSGFSRFCPDPLNEAKCRQVVFPTNSACAATGLINGMDQILEATRRIHVRSAVPVKGR